MTRKILALLALLLMALPAHAGSWEQNEENLAEGEAALDDYDECMVGKITTQTIDQAKSACEFDRNDAVKRLGPDPVNAADDIFAKEDIDARRSLEKPPAPQFKNDPLLNPPIPSIKIPAGLVLKAHIGAPETDYDDEVLSFYHLTFQQAQRIIYYQDCWHEAAYTKITNQQAILKNQSLWQFDPNLADTMTAADKSCADAEEILRNSVGQEIVTSLQGLLRQQALADNNALAKAAKAQSAR